MAAAGHVDSRVGTQSGTPMNQPSEAEVAARARAIRCLIADDHTALATLLSRFLPHRGITVVATASNGLEALEKIERLKPDVAVLDVRMPGIDGIAAARRAAATSPDTGIVLYTAHGELTLLSEALDIGVGGFLQKAGSLDELVRAIQTVAEGGTFVDPVLAAALLGGEQAPELSKREREVLRLLAAGLRNEEIGERLYLSQDTVRSYSGRAMEKLGADTRTEAVAVAIRQSLIA
jgi:DNA-binding NarL/FixJ family response regulator